MDGQVDIESLCVWFKRSFLYVLCGLKAEHLKNPSKAGRQIGAHFSCSFTFLFSTLSISLLKHGPQSCVYRAREKDLV